MFQGVLLNLFILSVSFLFLDRIDRIEEEMPHARLTLHAASALKPQSRKGRGKKHDTGTAKMAVAPEAAASAVALFRVGGANAHHLKDGNEGREQGCFPYYGVDEVSHKRSHRTHRTRREMPNYYLRHLRMRRSQPLMG